MQHSSPPTIADAPGAVPLLGHIPQLASRPLGFLASLPAQADVVRIRLGTVPAYLPCTPELVRHVLNEARVFDKGGPFFDSARLVFGNSLGTSQWEDHQRQRRLLQPAFQRDRVAGHVQAMCQEIEAVTASWATRRPVDINAELQRLSARVVIRALFSGSMPHSAIATVQDALPTIMRGMYRHTLLPQPLQKVPTPGKIRFDRARQQLHDVITGTVATRRAADDDRGDVLSSLLNPPDDPSGAPLTDQEIHDHALTLLVAGTETTSTCLSWALHLLTRHPDVLEGLRAEADAALPHRTADLTALPALPYTSRVLTETLRLYPPGWFLTRATTTDTQLAGHPLPAGTTVLWSPYVLHRDPKSFPDPHRFDPDRWLPERADRVPPGALLPFGAGARKCIGDTLAMTEATLALAHIVSHWHLRPLSDTAVRPKVRATLGTGPLLMHCTPRHSQEEPRACR